MNERDKVWAELHAVRPANWNVGTPVHHVERGEWAMYAFDTTERAEIGKRTREWTAVAPTEEGVVREMARCLRLLAEELSPR